MCGRGRIDIGDVDGEEGVVFADGGAEQQRLLLIDAHGEAGKMAGFGVKEAELGYTKIFDVAKAVGDEERIAGFEHTSAIVRERGRSADVIFVGDADNVRQNEEPS